MGRMSSDYHDVPHCIRQALATSPAPTHYSRVSESPSLDDKAQALTKALALALSLAGHLKLG